jgi:hypothetical protein
VVGRVIAGGTTVAWELAPEVRDPGPYACSLEHGTTSNPDADDWAVVAGPEDDAFALTDPDQRVYGLTDWGFYRVRAVTGSRTLVSEPVGALGTLDWRDWCLAREIARKETLVAALASQDGYLLKRRVSGPRCDSCYDPVARNALRADCPDCFGTGFACGYYAPLAGVWATLSTRTAHTRAVPGRGTVADVVHRARMLAAPLMGELDVWVARRTDARYYVHTVAHAAEVRGVPVVSEVELRQIPFSHPLYGLAMPGQPSAPGGCPA